MHAAASGSREHACVPCRREQQRARQLRRASISISQCASASVQSESVVDSDIDVRLAVGLYRPVAFPPASYDRLRRDRGDVTFASFASVSPADSPSSAATPTSVPSWIPNAPIDTLRAAAVLSIQGKQHTVIARLIRTACPCQSLFIYARCPSLCPFDALRQYQCTNTIL